MGCRVRAEVALEGLERLLQSASATLGSCVIDPVGSPMCALGDSQHLDTKHSELIGDLKAPVWEEGFSPLLYNPLFSSGEARSGDR